MSASLRRKLNNGENIVSDLPLDRINKPNSATERLDAIKSLSDLCKNSQDKINLLEITLKNNNEKFVDINTFNAMKSKFEKDLNIVLSHVESLEVEIENLKSSLDSKLTDLKEELFIVIEDNIISATPRIQGNVSALTADFNNKLELLELKIKQLEANNNVSIAKRSFSSRNLREAPDVEPVEPKKLVVNKIKIGQ